MSDCCGPQSCDINSMKKKQVENCPVSNTTGQKVGQPTVRAMLTAEAMKRLKNVDYRYCPDPDCDVVYFGPESVFNQVDLSKKVTQKSQMPNTPVCFCYGHTRGSIEAEIKAGGARVQRLKLVALSNKAFVRVMFETLKELAVWAMW